MGETGLASAAEKQNASVGSGRWRPDIEAAVAAKAECCIASQIEGYAVARHGGVIDCHIAVCIKIKFPAVDDVEPWRKARMGLDVEPATNP